MFTGNPHLGAKPYLRPFLFIIFLYLLFLFPTIEPGLYHMRENLHLCSLLFFI